VLYPSKTSEGKDLATRDGNEHIANVPAVSATSPEVSAKLSADVAAAIAAISANATIPEVTVSEPTDQPSEASEEQASDQNDAPATEQNDSTPAPTAPIDGATGLAPESKLPSVQPIPQAILDYAKSNAFAKRVVEDLQDVVTKMTKAAQTITANHATTDTVRSTLLDSSVDDEWNELRRNISTKDEIVLKLETELATARKRLDDYVTEAVNQVLAERKIDDSELKFAIYQYSTKGLPEVKSIASAFAGTDLEEVAKSYVKSFPTENNLVSGVSKGAPAGHKGKASSGGWRPLFTNVTIDGVEHPEITNVTQIRLELKFKLADRIYNALESAAGSRTLTPGTKYEIRVPKNNKSSDSDNKDDFHVITLVGSSKADK